MVHAKSVSRGKASSRDVKPPAVTILLADDHDVVRKGLRATLETRRTRVGFGARRYLLEVIETNTRAVALYESLGFTTTRPLTCWKRETGDAVSGVAIRTIEPDWDLFASFLDVVPSWQNSEASIRRARDPRAILGAFDGDLLAGYAIVFPPTHDLAQLAVRRTHRRRGIGAALLDRAAVEAEGMVRILNVDARDEGIDAFLRAGGAEQFIRQREMARPI